MTDHTNKEANAASSLLANAIQRNGLRADELGTIDPSNQIQTTYADLYDSSTLGIDPGVPVDPRQQAMAESPENVAAMLRAGVSPQEIAAVTGNLPPEGQPATPLQAAAPSEATNALTAALQRVSGEQQGAVASHAPEKTEDEAIAEEIIPLIDTDNALGRMLQDTTTKQGSLVAAGITKREALGATTEAKKKALDPYSDVDFLQTTLPEFLSATTGDRETLKAEWTARNAEAQVRKNNEGQGFDLNNLALGVTERGADLVGNLAGFAATAGANLDNDYHAGGIVWDDVLPSYLNAAEYKAWEAENPNSNTLRNIQNNLKDFDAGYVEGTSWEDVKNAEGILDTAGKLYTFGLESGLVSLPDMAAAVANLPLYVLSRGEEIATARAVNNGRDVPNAEDLSIGSFTAMIVSAMEKLGAEAVFTSFIKGKETAFKKVVKAVIGEGGTEAIQEPIEYLGETLGTDKEVTAAELGERSLQGAVGGAATGGTIATGGAVISGGMKVATGQTEKAKAAKKQRADASVAKQKVNAEAVQTGDFSKIEDVVEKARALTQRGNVEGVTDEERKATRAEQVELFASVSEEVIQLEEEAAVMAKDKATAKQGRALAKQAADLSRQAELLFTEIKSNTIKRGATEASVTALGDELAAAKEGDQGLEVKAQDFIDTLQEHPELGQLAQVKKLAASKNVTGSQRTALNNFVTTQEAIGDIKTGEDVTNDIIDGGKGFIGIRNFQKNINAATVLAAAGRAKEALAKLKKFGAAHAAKAKVFAEAQAKFDTTGETTILRGEGGVWAPITGFKKPSDFTIGDNSRNFNETLGLEVHALRAAYSESRAIINKAFPLEGVKDEQPSRKPSTSTPRRDQSDQRDTRDGSEQRTPERSTEVPAEAVSAPHSGVDGTVSEPLGVSGEGDVRETVSRLGIAEDPVTEEVVDEQTATDSFFKTNQFTKHFVAVAEKATTQFANPISKVTDIAGKIKQSTDFLLDYINLDVFSAQQDMALQQFAKLSTQMTKANKALWKATPKFKHNDYMQYLADEDGQLHDRVISSVNLGIFNWLSTQAGGLVNNSKSDINSILGRADDELVTPEMFDVLRHAGSLQSPVADAIGKDILKMIGWKAGPTAPGNAQAQMEHSLGKFAIAMMLKEGYVERRSLSATKFSELVGEEVEGIVEDATLSFIVPVNKQAVDEDGNELAHRTVGDMIEVISESVKETDSLFPKLFGLQSYTTGPTFEPVVTKGGKFKGTNQDITPDQAKVRNKHAARKHFYKKGAMSVFSFLGQANQLEMEGYDTNPDAAHVSERKGIDSNNAAIFRGVESMNTHSTEVNNWNDGSDNTPFYFSHEYWVMGRMGMVGNGVNIQSNKMHRHMIYQESWASDIAFNDADMLGGFRLAVAESFGVATDKQTNDISLAQFKELMQTPVMKAGVDAAVAVLGGSRLKAHQTAIMAAVKEGGEKTYSLDGLVAYAEMLIAQKDPTKSSFTTTLFREVDGVTNGPILGLAMFAAANNSAELGAKLNKGGFYGEGDVSTYSEWKTNPAHQDAYQEVAILWQQAIDVERQGNTDGMREHAYVGLHTFLGDIAIDGSTIKTNGRNLTKNPLTITVYGASEKKVKEQLGEAIIASAYTQITKAVNNKDQDALNAIWENLARVAGGANQMGDFRLTLTTALETEIPFKTALVIKQQTEALYGEPLMSSINDNYGKFKATQQALNKAVGATNKAFMLQYEFLVEKRTEEMIASGELATTVEKRKGQADRTVLLETLSKAELDKILAQLKESMPFVHTYFSEKTGSLDNALDLTNTTQTRKYDRAHKTTQTYAEGVPTLTGDGESVLEKSSKGYTTERTYEDTGVAPVVMLIHSVDGAIMTLSLDETGALNVHDAQGLGINESGAGAEVLNKNTYKVLTDYSIGNAVAETFERTMERAIAFDKANGTDFATTIAESLLPEGESYDSTPAVFIQTLVKNMRGGVAGMDSRKHQMLAKQHNLSQYNLDGSPYAVTAEDRARNEAKVGAAPVVKTKAPVKLTAQTLVVDTASVQTEVNTAMDQFISDKGGELDAAGIVELIDLLLEQGASTAADAILLKQLQSMIGVDMKVVMVSEAKEGRPTSTARGAYDPANNTVYLNSGMFIGHGMSTETLAHELVHAVTTAVLQTTSKDPRTLAVKQSLENILVKASQLVRSMEDGPKKQRYLSALKDSSELVAWGMTDTGFQNDVLSKIEVVKDKTRLTGLKAFAQSLLKALFPSGSAAVSSKTMENAMVALVKATGVVMEIQAKKKGPEVSLQVKAQDFISSMTSMQVFGALATFGTTTDSHLARIIRIQEDIVNKVHGALGNEIRAARADTPETAVDSFLDAVASGTNPVVSKAAAAGFKMTGQEVYVLEQLEATVRDGINEHSVAKREAAKLFRLARESLTAEVFLDGKWDDATLEEQTSAQTKFDYIFRPTLNADGKTSDYLHRFVSMGLANRQLAEALVDMGAPDSPTLRYMNVWDALVEVLTRLLNTIGSIATGTRGVQANEKLEELAAQLAGIDARKKSTIHKSLTTGGEYITDKIDEVVAGAKGTLVNVATSKVIKESSFTLVRAGGVAAEVVLGGKIEEMMEVFRKIADRFKEGRQGLLASILTEARGQNDSNWRFYNLMRFANKDIDQARKQAISWTAEQVMDEFVNGGADITEADATAISKVLIKADLQSLLDKRSLASILKLINDPTYLKQEINKLNQQLGNFGNETKYYRTAAHQLGFFMATGRDTSDNLQMNAHNIAFLAGTPNVGAVGPQADAAIPVIDQLASLHALSYTSSIHKKAAGKVLTGEMAAHSSENGFRFTLMMHKKLVEEANTRLFDDAPIHFIKGYTKETLNPHISVVVAPVTSREELEAQGYTQGRKVSRDPNDPSQDDMYVWKNSDGGMSTYMAGIMSQTSRKAKGTSLGKSHVQNNDGTTSAMTRREMAAVASQRKAGIAKMFTQDNFDPLKVKETKLSPVVDTAGQLSGYRYLMSEQVKDDLMEKDNDFSRTLGAMAGSIIDKAETKKYNDLTVQALYDQYVEDFAEKSNSYIEISATSTDPKLKEIWHMLPQEAKDKVKATFGGKSILIRNDLLDLVFGYRKHSITDKFKKSERGSGEIDERNLYEQMFVELAEKVFGKSISGKLKRGENMWMELIKEVKDIIVIKNFFTLYGNVVSNVSVLFVSGVPIKNIIRDHRIALQGITEYQTAIRKVHDLRQLLELGQRPGQVSAIEQEIAVLENSISTNPVKELVDAGVFQSIIEDIESESQTFTYKTRAGKSLSKLTSRIPEAVKKAGNVAYLSHDTKLYKLLNHGTQISDFVARYVQYQHLITKSDPLTKEQAVFVVSDTFVNYDLPTHKAIQFGNDVGILWFTKYYLRIQKVIFNLFKEKPALALALIAAQEYGTDFSAINDSSMLANSVLNRFNNPFSSILTAPGDIVTMNAGSSLLGL